MSDKAVGRATALFDDAAFAEDLRRASDVGQEAALAARQQYEQGGVPVDDLLACDEVGADGTRLPHCVKIYLPRPNGGVPPLLRTRLIRLTLPLSSFD